jgi:dipeptide transport system permease protein
LRTRWGSTSRCGSSSSTTSGGILHGDFGTSLVSKTVLTEFLTLFPATLELTLLRHAVCLAARHSGRRHRGRAARRPVYDQTLMGVALTGYSMPIFWWGLILILVMSNTLGLTPVSGPRRSDQVLLSSRSPALPSSIPWLSGQKGRLLGCGAPPDLPSIVLGTVPLAVIARMTRSAMLEVLKRTTCAPPAPRACRAGA